MKSGKCFIVQAIFVGLSFAGSVAYGDDITPDKAIAPDTDAAAQRVELAKAKLDQSKQQLIAAKAILKAAEAEFRAARADQDALALRTQARKLADASGLPESTNLGTRLYPVDTKLVPTPGNINANTDTAAISPSPLQSSRTDQPNIAQ